MEHRREKELHENELNLELELEQEKLSGIKLEEMSVQEYDRDALDWEDEERDRAILVDRQREQHQHRERHDRKREAEANRERELAKELPPEREPAMAEERGRELGSSLDPAVEQNLKQEKEHVPEPQDVAQRRVLTLERRWAHRRGRAVPVPAIHDISTPTTSSNAVPHHFALSSGKSVSDSDNSTWADDTTSYVSTERVQMDSMGGSRTPTAAPETYGLLRDASKRANVRGNLPLLSGLLLPAEQSLWQSGSSLSQTPRKGLRRRKTAAESDPRLRREMETVLDHQTKLAGEVAHLKGELVDHLDLRVRHEKQRCDIAHLEESTQSIFQKSREDRAEFDDAVRHTAELAAEAQNLKLQLSEVNARNDEEMTSLLRVRTGFTSELDLLKEEVQVFKASNERHERGHIAIEAVTSEVAELEGELRDARARDRSERAESRVIRQHRAELSGSVDALRCEVRGLRAEVTTSRWELSESDTQLAHVRRAELEVLERFQAEGAAWRLERGELETKLTRLHCSENEALRHVRAEVVASSERENSSEDALLNARTRAARLERVLDREKVEFQQRFEKLRCEELDEADLALDLRHQLQVAQKGSERLVSELHSHRTQLSRVTVEAEERTRADEDARVMSRELTAATDTELALSQRCRLLEDELLAARSLRPQACPEETWEERRNVVVAQRSQDVARSSAVASPFRSSLVPRSDVLPSRRRPSTEGRQGFRSEASRARGTVVADERPPRAASSSPSDPSAGTVVKQLRDGRNQDTFASTVAVSDDSSSSSVPPPWRYKLPAKEAASSGRMASTPQRTPAKLSAQSAEGVESHALGPVQTKGRVTGVIRSASGSALEASSVARRGDGADAGTRLRLQMGAASRSSSSSSCDMTRNGREPAGQGVGGCADRAGGDTRRLGVGGTLRARVEDDQALRGRVAELKRKLASRTEEVAGWKALGSTPHSGARADSATRRPSVSTSTVSSAFAAGSRGATVAAARQRAAPKASSRALSSSSESSLERIVMVGNSRVTSRARRP